MKRLACLLVCFGLFRAVCGEAETISIGYWNHKPHQYLSADGSTRGAAITHFTMMAANMGVDVEWVGPLPFVRLVNALRDGSVDGSVSYGSHKSGLGDFVYSGDQPTFLSYAVLVVRADNPLTQIASIQDVKGYRIGWLEGVEPSLFLRQHLASVQIDYITPSDTMWEQSLKKLLLGRIDAIHELNEYTLIAAAKEMGVADQIKVLRLPEPGEPVFVVFSKQSPNGKRLAEAYNAAQAAAPFSQADYENLVQQEFETFKK